MAMRAGKSLLTTAVVALVLTLGISSSQVGAQEKQSSPSTSPGQVGKDSGPRSCAASNCHGSVGQKKTTRIWQNEYSIWAAQDKHSRAYNVLSNQVSIRMGKILKLSASPSQSEKCLV